MPYQQPAESGPEKSKDNKEKVRLYCMQSGLTAHMAISSPEKPINQAARRLVAPSTHPCRDKNEER
jgi:hypothetical protein